MAEYVVTFNGSMDEVTADQLTSIKSFLEAEITVDYNGEDDTWLVDTDKNLTPRLMNTALARAGVRNRQVVSIAEE